MKRILVVRPSKRDRRELAQFSKDYSFSFHNYSKEEAHKVLYQPESDLRKIVDELVNQYRGSIDGLIYTTDYIGTSLGSILGHRFGFVGPDPEKVLLCQHKYYARVAQQQHVPEAVPDFFTFDLNEVRSELSNRSFPLFIKPVKSVFSINAFRVDSTEQAEHAIATREADEYYTLFQQFIQQYTPYEFNPDHYLAEGLLEGVQVTIEGYVCRGSITIIGIVDSVMFDNHISFSRFEYPSKLPVAIQRRMADITERVISGIGLDNSFFNIEFMYNRTTDAIHIIEINPRIASQFADIFQKVDGQNTYSLLLDLAVGNVPRRNVGSGRYNVAASFVLRTFQDKYVRKVPMSEEIEQLHCRFPDSYFELSCVKGTKLSDSMQDGHSFRYGLVHLGAQSWPELYQAFDEAQRILQFRLEPVQ